MTDLSRRTFMTTSGALVLGGVLAGCTPRSTAPGGTTPPATGGSTSAPPVEVRSTWWGGDVRSAKFNSIYDAYTAAHPNVTIGREPVADFAGYFAKLPVQFTGGNAPDIVHFTERQVANFAAQLTDLSKVSTLDLSYFSDTAIEAGTYKDSLIMLLIGGTIPSTMYNKTLFEEAGVAVPTNAWTWDTLVSSSRALRDALPKGTVGITYQAVAAPIFDTVLHQDGKGLFAPDFSAQLNFTAEDATKWFQLWKDLLDEGLCQTAQQASEETGSPFEDTMFAKGQAVIHVQNSNQLVTFQTAIGEKYELGLAIFPQVGAKPVAYQMGSYVSINASSKVIDEAGSVVDFFVNDPAANKLFGLELGSPGNSNRADAVKADLAAPDAKVLAFANDTASIAVPALIRPVGGDQAETIMTQIALAVGFGQQTPAEAGAAFVDQLAAAIKAS